MEAAVLKSELISYMNSNTSRAKVTHDQRMAKWNATRSSFDCVSPISTPGYAGLSCKGCQAALERRSERVLSSVQIYALLDRTFTEDMFPNHFAENFK